MPRKPRFIHPVRQVRTALGLSQPNFAKLIGCSAVAVQRIENGTLPLSTKLAIRILEATGAAPVSLLAGRDAKALDAMGQEYTKASYALYKGAIPSMSEDEMKFLAMRCCSHIQLLFAASHRGGKAKTYALHSALEQALITLASHFDLTKSIHNFLIQNDHFEKRIYRVGDLRKFSDYARILGYKDNKRYKPEKLVAFNLPRGWIKEYYLRETPVLPHGADMKLADKTYILDSERGIPPEIKEAVAQAVYWEIKEFRTSFATEPHR